MVITLDALMAAARKLIEADAAVQKAEVALAERVAYAKTIREETLPNAMLELGLQRLVLNTGETLKLSQDVYASIPKAGQAEAFAWLVTHKFDGIIKTEVAVSFGKGDYKAALKIQAMLLKKRLPATCEQSIHHSTLKAFLRERMAEGSNIPLELFGAWPVFTTKLTTK